MMDLSIVTHEQPSKKRPAPSEESEEFYDPALGNLSKLPAELRHGIYELMLSAGYEQKFTINTECGTFYRLGASLPGVLQGFAGLLGAPATSRPVGLLYVSAGLRADVRMQMSDPRKVLDTLSTTQSKWRAATSSMERFRHAVAPQRASPVFMFRHMLMLPPLILGGRTTHENTHTSHQD